MANVSLFLIVCVFSQFSRRQMKPFQDPTVSYEPIPKRQDSLRPERRHYLHALEE